MDLNNFLNNIPQNLIVSPVPHIRASITTRRIMLRVIIALVPAIIASVIIFGLRALMVEAVTVASCVLMEYLWCTLRHEAPLWKDLSAVVTGILLAFNMPASVPLYLPVIGSVVAIIVTKQFFGGIGKNFANPAIVARITLAVSFPSLMTAYTYPQPVIPCDAISSATPLAVTQKIPLLDLFLGTHGGVIGETCALALLIGLVYLLATGTVDFTIPVTYVGAVALISLIAGKDVLHQILSGGLLLGAIFMATDYVTSPFTRKGKIIFALGCAAITCVIRFFGNMNEGVSYSILLMNLLVPFINAKTRKIPMGGKVKTEEKKRG